MTGKKEALRLDLFGFARITGDDAWLVSFGQESKRISRWLGRGVFF